MSFAPIGSYRYIIQERHGQFVSILLASSVQLVLCDTGGGFLKWGFTLGCAAEVERLAGRLAHDRAVFCTISKKKICVCGNTGVQV